MAAARSSRSFGQLASFIEVRERGSTLLEFAAVSGRSAILRSVRVFSEKPVATPKASGPPEFILAEFARWSGLLPYRASLSI